MKKSIIALGIAAATAAMSGMLTSCVETDSTLVEYVENNKLNSPNDTVYSLVGIINKMQAIADRTILLGELRGDLCALNANADLDLQDIANFTVGAENPYNNARDYYAIIQNCNYFIANADTTLSKRGEKIFERELAVVRTYRAWTYMQLALNYGSVPFFTDPILTEKDGDPSLYPKYDIDQIADYFIKELEPLVDVRYPQYGQMNSLPSKLFFIPVRVLLGDLCLWSGRYEEACKHYYNYLTVLTDPSPINTRQAYWSNRNFEGRPSNIYTGQYSASNSSTITIIPMATDEYDGIVTYLDDVFSSTEDNNYFYQASASQGYIDISRAQRYTYLDVDPVTHLNDTIYMADDQYLEFETYRGDCRYSTLFDLRSRPAADYYSQMRQTISKYKTDANYVAIYRLPTIYLRFAEALNRAGLPEVSFAVLKYGLSYNTLNFANKYGEFINVISEATTAKVEELATRIGVNVLNFNQYQFDETNTMGIHARGCGDVKCDSLYIIPELPMLADSVLFVEDLICDEMALDLSFEGTRFYDLMRISRHRNDPTFLADKVARRNGQANRNEALFTKLSDDKNWYLKLE